MIKAVIFDMDGVLLDTEPLHSKSLEYILLEHKKKPLYNEQGLLHTVGLSGDHIYKDFIKKYDLPHELEAFKRKRREFFLEIIKKEAVINNGILPLLKRLKKAKLAIGLGSNRNIEHINAILDTLQIKQYFSVLIGPSATLKHKPAPDIYLETARLLQAKSHDCIVIEDSEAGVTAAHAAGMKIIAVPNHYTAHHDFSKADMIIKSFKEIKISLLQNLYGKPN